MPSPALPVTVTSFTALHLVPQILLDPPPGLLHLLQPLASTLIPLIFTKPIPHVPWVSAQNSPADETFTDRPPQVRSYTLSYTTTLLGPLPPLSLLYLELTMASLIVYVNDDLAIVTTYCQTSLCSCFTSCGGWLWTRHLTFLASEIGTMMYTDKVLHIFIWLPVL